MYNLYPQQLAKIAKIIDGLDKMEDDLGIDGDWPVMLKQHIPVVDGEGSVLGYLVDEIGGAWSFTMTAPKDEEK